VTAQAFDVLHSGTPANPEIMPGQSLVLQPEDRARYIRAASRGSDMLSAATGEG
jgi:hypothetical protein